MKYRMGGACSMHGIDKNTFRIFLRKPEETGTYDLITHIFNI
jgi:hypothetical protein